MIRDLGVLPESEAVFRELFAAHEQKICIGEDINIFLKEAKEKLGLQVANDYSMTADFVNRFEKNPSLIELIAKLKQDFKIGLLTNQYPGMLEMIFKKGLVQKELWDIIIDSSIEKVRKPDQGIFQLAEEKAKVDPSSILFVENSVKHLDAARERNWLTFEYDPANPKDSTERLETYIYGGK